MANINNINNINIVTFIKDIYLSLQHIDICFNSYKENINTKLQKIEDNQQIIIEKINNIEQLVNKATVQKHNVIDSKIENELLEKMSKFNKDDNNNNIKLQLKPTELTLANILENNYNILDINTTLETYNNVGIINGNSNGNGTVNDTLESLLF